VENVPKQKKIRILTEIGTGILKVTKSVIFAKNAKNKT